MSAASVVWGEFEDRHAGHLAQIARQLGTSYLQTLAVAHVQFAAASTHQINNFSHWVLAATRRQLQRELRPTLPSHIPGDPTWYPVVFLDALPDVLPFKVEDEEESEEEKEKTIAAAIFKLPARLQPTAYAALRGMSERQIAATVGMAPSSVHRQIGEICDWLAHQRQQPELF